MSTNFCGRALCFFFPEDLSDLSCNLLESVILRTKPNYTESNKVIKTPKPDTTGYGAYTLIHQY